MHTHQPNYGHEHCQMACSFFLFVLCAFQLQAICFSVSELYINMEDFIAVQFLVSFIFYFPIDSPAHMRRCSQNIIINKNPP